jgi:hypothetical protein
MHEDRTATVNEAQAIQERKDSLARNKMRNNERQARPVPEAKVYELTVENSGDPGLPDPQSYYSTNVVSTSYVGIPPTIYYRDGTNLLALPGKSAVISGEGANVVATWTNFSDLGFPADPAKLTGVSLVGNSLSITNPVELDRVPTDPYLDETEHILEDYISLNDHTSLQIVSH